MDDRRGTISLALIVLICFFLPWVQLSCGQSESRLGGVDLARDGHSELWLIPFLMLSVLLIATARIWKDRREISGLSGLLAGLVSAYLMNRERARAESSSGLVAVGLTVWFWLGIGATIGLSILSSWRFLKRSRPN
jgi:membrane associated rhomboid family serine protease